MKRSFNSNGLSELRFPVLILIIVASFGFPRRVDEEKERHTKHSLRACPNDQLALTPSQHVRTRVIPPARALPSATSMIAPLTVSQIARRAAKASKCAATRR